jgi:SAM-dependent methyltransferase
MIVGIDPSDEYISYARTHILDVRIQFRSGTAQALPVERGSFDVVVSGLALNFVPDPEMAMAEMRRVIQPAGMVAAYVWDYADKMELIRYFWDAAVALNSDARSLDEGVRFPLCTPENLRRLFTRAGLRDITVDPIDVPTHFSTFDDYWFPFLGGQGPAPGYAMSLSDERRTELRERIQRRLPVAADGSIRLMARAWAIRGRTQTVPAHRSRPDSELM